MQLDHVAQNPQVHARHIHIGIHMLIISGNRPNMSICSTAWSGNRPKSSICSTAWQETTARMYPVELVADLIEPGAPSADIVASLSISIELAFLLRGNKTLVSLVG